MAMTSTWPWSWAPAALLKGSPPLGMVLFVFQPVEELGNGSCVMLKPKMLNGVNAIIAGYVTHYYLVGEIMVSSGTITAQSVRFTVRVRGRGGMERAQCDRGRCCA